MTLSKNATAWGHRKPPLKRRKRKALIQGLTVDHPFDPSIKLPVYAANFVLMDYGTGAIFGSAGHDQRDLDFANKYNLPVIPVVLPEGEDPESFKSPTPLIPVTAVFTIQIF